MTRKKDPRTVAAGNGIASDAAFGAVTPPIYLSSTFSFAGYEQSRPPRLFADRQSEPDMLADTLANLKAARALWWCRRAWRRSTWCSANWASTTSSWRLTIATGERSASLTAAPKEALQGPVRRPERRAGVRRGNKEFALHWFSSRRRAIRSCVSSTFAPSQPAPRLSRRQDRCRQHVLSPALQRQSIRSGLRGSFDHQIPQRPFGRGRRRGHRDRQERCGDARGLGQHHRVTGAPFDAYLLCAACARCSRASSATGHGVRDRRLPSNDAPGLAPSTIPACDRPRPRAGLGAAGGIRRDAELRARRRHGDAVRAFVEGARRSSPWPSPSAASRASSPIRRR